VLDRPGVLDGRFDSFSSENIWKSTVGSTFGSLTFGNVAPAGLSQESVLNDLAVSASLGDGDAPDIKLRYVPAPEPATFVLVVLSHVLPVRLRSSA
jgi:hypothetical protein